jgi:hypothetical protein
VISGRLSKTELIRLSPKVLRSADVNTPNELYPGQANCACDVRLNIRTSISRDTCSLGATVNALGARMLTSSSAWINTEDIIGKKREPRGRMTVLSNASGAGRANRLSMVYTRSGSLPEACHFYNPH